MLTLATRHYPSVFRSQQPSNARAADRNSCEKILSTSDCRPRHACSSKDMATSLNALSIHMTINSLNQMTEVHAALRPLPVIQVYAL